MPWRESCAMDQRVRFIADHKSGSWTMTELCERYEISRKTGTSGWIGIERRVLRVWRSARMRRGCMGGRRRVIWLMR